jgi:hypothetical protein
MSTGAGRYKRAGTSREHGMAQISKSINRAVCSPIGRSHGQASSKHPWRLRSRMTAKKSIPRACARIRRSSTPSGAWQPSRCAAGRGFNSSRRTLVAGVNYFFRPAVLIVAAHSGIRTSARRAVPPQGTSVCRCDRATASTGTCAEFQLAHRLRGLNHDGRGCPLYGGSLW